jgi:hypothetical protein
VSIRIAARLSEMTDKSLSREWDQATVVAG